MDLNSEIIKKIEELAIDVKELRDHICLRLNADKLTEVVSILKNHYSFEVLTSVTAVDYLDEDFSGLGATERFDVVYHLLSIKNKSRVRIKVALSETKPEIASLFNLYKSANFLEREVFDMYGIVFKDHPDLRRILMYKEFKGHPLRKDYPLQGKQPRVKLIRPEVENTAQFMDRPQLIKIGQNDSKQGVR